VFRLLDLGFLGNLLAHGFLLMFAKCANGLFM
jgi:hypothetical protein